MPSWCALTWLIEALAAAGAAAAGDAAAAGFADAAAAEMTEGCSCITAFFCKITSHGIREAAAKAHLFICQFMIGYSLNGHNELGT